MPASRDSAQPGLNVGSSGGLLLLVDRRDEVADLETDRFCGSTAVHGSYLIAIILTIVENPDRLKSFLPIPAGSFSRCMTR